MNLIIDIYILAKYYGIRMITYNLYSTESDADRI